MGSILLVEDDQPSRAFISTGLREHGHVVVEACSLLEGAALAQANAYDLWIFDRRLPDGDAATVLAGLRSEGRETPALFLTAATETEQRIIGLEAGADDYLTKPFSFAELALRVKALLRRRPVLQFTCYRVGNVDVDTHAHRASVNGHDVCVTTNEWRLLNLLAERPGQVFDREAIISRVGIAEDADSVAVNHLVSRLRRKLQASHATITFRSVRGVGYSLEPKRSHRHA